MVWIGGDAELFRVHGFDIALKDHQSNIKGREISRDSIDEVLTWLCQKFQALRFHHNALTLHGKFDLCEVGFLI